MGYPLRDEPPDTWHHVGTRGNNRRLIYVDDASRNLYMLRLAIVIARYGWTMSAYCLMPNHYHLLIKIGTKGMSRGMQDLNGGYARAFNQRHGRRDHLFGRRFWSRQLVDDDDFLETCRYIELNPARTEQPLDPRTYRWSSHRATLGLAAPQPSHSPAEVWARLDEEPRTAMAVYDAYSRERLMETRLVSDTGRTRP